MLRAANQIQMNNAPPPTDGKIPAPRRPLRAGERLLVATSSSGLGNRLLLLAGAQRIAEQTNRRLLLHWPVNDQLGCAFEELFTNQLDRFEPGDLDFLLRTDRSVKVYNTWRHSGPLYTEVARDGDPDAEMVILKGWIAARYAGEHRTTELDEEIGRYLRTLTPRAEFLDAARAWPLPPRTVGVHLRRGDPTREFVDEYMTVDDQQFLTLMDAVLAAEPETHFFLATDHPPTEARWRERFGARLLFRKKNSLQRDRSAMAEAMLDCLLLGRTAGVIGTHFSTFSEIAARLGDTPLALVGPRTAGRAPGEVVEPIVRALRARAAH